MSDVDRDVLDLFAAVLDVPNDIAAANATAQDAMNDPATDWQPVDPERWQQVKERLRSLGVRI